MEKSKLILPISILLASIIFGGFYYAGQINKQQTVQNTLSNIDLQAKCADAAEKYFVNSSHGNRDVDGWSRYYTNHYNVKLDTCFILVSSVENNLGVVNIDLYDALEGAQYATYFGHDNCKPIDLVVLGDSKRCQLDGGSIWLNSNNKKNSADYSFGFQGITNGPGVGDENTQKQFMEKVQLSFLDD